MANGQQTLHSIDESLQQVRTELREMDRQIQSVSDEGVRLRQAAAALYQRLAELRLDELAKGSVRERLSDADRRVNQLLEQRNEQLANQERELDACHARQLELEQQRQAQRNLVATASQALDRAEAATQERLRHDPDYQKQLDTAHQAEDIATQALEKTEQAEEDRLEKGKPYESDPLFMYLWQRKFGTSEYQANSLMRLLDNWVARLCRYHAARPNFAMLNEIPVRLREHWQRLKTDADKEFAALEELEEAAAAEDQIPELRAELVQAQQKSDEIDLAIQQQEEQYRQLVEQRSAFAAGQDDYSRQSSDLLLQELQRESLVQLRRRAARTATAEDDQIIRQLTDLDEEYHEVEEILDQHRQVHQRHLNRLNELEEIRRKFKQNRYDSTHSTFANGALLGSMLTEFLRGMANSDELWKTIASQHRSDQMQSDPWFGSGGFGRKSGGVWKTPRSRAPRSNTTRTRSTTSRSRSSGGFRTGGGF
jgi:chromosome segregation ATPase